MPGRLTDAMRWQVRPLGLMGPEPTGLPPGRPRQRLPHVQRRPDHLPALGYNGPALGLQQPPHGWAVLTS